MYEYMIDATNLLLQKKIDENEFFKQLQINKNEILNLILEILDCVLNIHDKKITEYVIYLICRFKTPLDKITNQLNLLLIEEWHEKHEDIASLLQDARSPSSIENLYKTVFVKYEYLDYDDCYALAVKCIWALGDIGTSLAIEKLKNLLSSDNVIIRDNAKYQLERLEII